ncbi:helix-turn-helix domain-containing protein [Svornostia abyssi]|uniref:Helix-turn-helix domain-containing protein n=1 Tax=Svornostia abyssi TaxID=2898438 RepID=A0ABY5PG12_9ACTN|nr:helix-turn-helix domain-containing protein [Parviterribacteraceae bacterium J379]
MDDRASLLRLAMSETGTTQSALARISGVRQPSISQILSGAISASDEQLNRLLACMGYRAEVTRRLTRPDLTRSERRSWLLHRQLARHLDRETLDQWRPVMQSNCERLRGNVQGQPHERNLTRWETAIEAGDLGGLHRALTGLDRDAIEMREVSPMSGLLAEGDRSSALAAAP